VIEKGMGAVAQKFNAEIAEVGSNNQKYHY
jgi:hypothetical protein